MDQLITIDRSGPTAVLTLDDPRHRNILTARLVHEIGTALDDLESDPSIGALVVTGNGSAFCAGADLATLEDASRGSFDLIRAVYGGFLRILHSPLLTIAAINGPAVGAGLNLALACDVRIAAESARFVCRFPELKIFPGGGHTWLLTRAVGVQLAATALLLGRTWDAQDALRDGLVAEVVPTEHLLSSVMERTAGLAALEPEYVRRLTGVLRSTAHLEQHEQVLATEAVHQEWSIRRPAFTEGLAQLRASLGRS